MSDAALRQENDVWFAMRVSISYPLLANIVCYLYRLLHAISYHFTLDQKDIRFFFNFTLH